jgi:hypothetical protein
MNSLELNVAREDDTTWCINIAFDTSYEAASELEDDPYQTFCQKHIKNASEILQANNSLRESIWLLDLGLGI